MNSMTQKEKQLLIKDLCMRLPYQVVVSYKNSDTREAYNQILDPMVYSLVQYIPYVGGLVIKPYLRPMSSMTEKEKKAFDDFCVVDEFAWNGNAEKGYPNQAIIMSDGIDWLLEHHFDFRGLIEKGLALEAPEDMYKNF